MLLCYRKTCCSPNNKVVKADNVTQEVENNRLITTPGITTTTAPTTKHGANTTNHNYCC